MERHHTKKLVQTIIGCGLWFMTLTGYSQVERKVDSRITDVTVFLNRAQVTREVKTRVDGGKTNIILTGLTGQLDQQSVQVAGKGSFTILGIAHQQNYLQETNLPKSLRMLKDSVAILQKQLLFEQSQKEILNKEEQMLISNQKIGGTSQNLSVAELKGMADFYRARLSEIVTSRMKQDDKISRVNERLSKLQLQINEQHAFHARNTGEIVVSVSASGNTAVELDVKYIVANAGWYPVYDLRASNTKSPVQLNYKANVFQSTGEEWDNVRLKLSTANPSQHGMKPELEAWYLDFQQNIAAMMSGQVYGMSRVRRDMDSDDKFKEIVVEEKAEAAAPAETVADFVTTIQTTLNTEFAIALPYSVQASGKPTVVDIRNHEVPADYLYSVVPKLDPDAFLVARLTGWEEFSLLPGEANVFFEGTFVAKTFIDPNNVKDTLSISLGRDKRIVVKREKLKDFSSRKTIGSNQRENFTYEISVRNTKAEPIRILIEDQLPVSQNSQIEIEAVNIGGALHTAHTGKLVWDMKVQPSESKKVKYAFQVKYPKAQAIPAL